MVAWSHKFGQNIMEVGGSDMEELLYLMIDKDKRQRETGRRWGTSYHQGPLVSLLNDFHH